MQSVTQTFSIAAIFFYILLLLDCILIIHCCSIVELDCRECTIKKYVEIMMMSWVRDELGLSAVQRLQMDGREIPVFLSAGLHFCKKKMIMSSVMWNGFTYT